MIIITADDYGRSCLVTDSILRCFSSGLIGSASAMVFMGDSERAAPLALQAGMEIGLHINFTEPFSAEAVPAILKDHQDKVAAFLKRKLLGQIIYNPRLARSFALLFNAQEEEFIRLYGRRPDFYNGHHHMHLCANMLWSRVLPRGARMRGTFTFNRGEKNEFNRIYRRYLNLAVNRKYISTDGFFSVLPLRDHERLRKIFDLATMKDIEIEVHPENADELEFLYSDRYATLLKSARVGGFRELRSRDKNKGP